MEYKNSIYYRVGKATDLSGSDRFVYRLLEILPGFLTWATVLLMFVCPVFFPYISAIFIIVFDIYWLLKSFYYSIFLYQNWRKTTHNINIDWKNRILNFKYDHIYHIILLPFYNESYEVAKRGLDSILKSKYDMSKIIIVMASEERAGDQAKLVSNEIIKNFKDKFGHLLITVHPKDLPGEMAGKGSNIAYAADQAKIQILDKEKIPYEDVIVSAFDIDTVVLPDYFNCLTWNYLTVEDPLRTSFQPVPFYNNNLWDTNVVSRLSSASVSLLQMTQQERPDTLETFSSHSMSFKALYELGYWQKNMVSEDSRIFWNAFLAYNGNYKVVPMSYPIYMDANLASTFGETLKNIYKQQRRWSWGVENIPYVLFGFIKNKKIPLKKKILFSYLLIDGFWTRSMVSLVILLSGWFILWFGGRNFNSTVLSYNLPIITGYLMSITMAGLLLSVFVSFGFLPPHPGKFGWKEKIFFGLQWFLIPFLVIFVGSIPSIDAQTRLMFGKYMGFWITPKLAKKKDNIIQNSENIDIKNK
jgi:hypothetical protein